MKVDSSIFSSFAPRPRASSSISEAKLAFEAAPPKTVSARQTDAQLVDGFYARLTTQNLDFTDTDKNGSVTKAEYLDGAKKLAAMNDRVYDPAIAERHWAVLDPTGKGALDESELRDGLEKLLPVGVGHLSANFAERLRAKQNFG